MARISIEDEWFSDPRRYRLAEKFGFPSDPSGLLKADGHAVEVWFFAQKYWRKKELIPTHAWEGAGLGDAMFQCGLAEKRDGGIYVRGAERHFDWYFKKTASLTAGAQLGGRARMTNCERDEHGRLLPAKSNIVQPEVQPTSSRSSPSFSSSSSSSSSKNKTNTRDAPQCVAEWGLTLRFFGIDKDPNLDAPKLLSMVQRHGVARVSDALLGMQAEPASEGFNPANHVSIFRLAKPQAFDRLANIGARERERRAKTAATRNQVERARQVEPTAPAESEYKQDPEKMRAALGGLLRKMPITERDG